MTRLTLGLDSPATLGALAATATCLLACWRAWGPARLSPVAAIPTMAALGAAIALLAGSLSRGAALAAILALAIAAIAGRAGASPHRWRAAVCTIGLIIVATLGWPRGIERGGALLQGTTDPGTATRLHQAYGALLVLHDLPWTGAGALGGDTAVHLLLGNPAHLRGQRDLVLAGVLNDPLQVAIDHGMPTLLLLLAAGGALIGIGISAARRGRAVGAALAGATACWGACGLSSNVWFAQAAATWPVALALAALAAVAIHRREDRRAALRWAAAGSLAVPVLAIAILLPSSLACDRAAEAAGIPRLVRDAASGHAALAAAPRGPRLGKLAWLPGGSHPAAETLRDVQLPLARTGWMCEVVERGGSDALAVLADPQRADDALAGTGTVVALGWPADAAARAAAHPARIILAYGIPDPDGLAEAAALAAPALRMVRPRVGRLWPNRVPAVWKAVEASLPPPAAAR